MKFRKEALARNASEVLDLPVRLTRPRGWIVLVVLVAVVLGGGVWGLTAALPRTLDAAGIITSAEGSFTVQTAIEGRVTRVFIKRGAVLHSGDPVVRVTDGTSLSTVRAAAAGRVFSLSVQVGQVVRRGDVMAVGERAETAADKAVAVLYLPSAQVATVRVGQRVDLNVESVPVSRYGLLRGRVVSVDLFDSSRRDAANFLGDETLAQALVGGTAARRVLVDLLEASTVSGYAWSTVSGPPFSVGSRTGVRARINQPPVRPIDWLLPK